MSRVVASRSTRRSFSTTCSPRRSPGCGTSTISSTASGPEGVRRWRGGEAEIADDQIICHHDPGAYNWIIQSGHFVAMIDWDMAGPGRPIEDLAFLAWTGIPLYREIPIEDVARRLDLLVDAYGEWGPMTVLDAVVERMTTASDRIEAGQARGDEGFRQPGQGR